MLEIQRNRQNANLSSDTLRMPCTEQKAASVKAEDAQFQALCLFVLYTKSPLEI